MFQSQMLEEEEDRIQAVLLLTLCLPDINRHTLQVQNKPLGWYCHDRKYSSRKTLFLDLRTVLFQAIYTYKSKMCVSQCVSGS